MQDLNDLYYFVQVVDHRGFAPAGRHLNVPKSTLSRRVALLEKRLDVLLIQRSTRHFSVTDIGQQYYHHCKAMLVEAEAAEETIERARAEPCGVVRVTCPVALLHARVHAMLVDFLVAYPDVILHLEATNRRVDVVEEGVDLAIRVRAAPLEDSELMYRIFSERGRVLVASPALIASGGAIRVPADLHGRPSVDLAPAEGEHLWALEGPGGAEALVRHRPRLVTDDMIALRAAAAAAIGIAQLPSLMVIDEIGRGELVRLLPGWAPKRHLVHAVYASRRGLLPSVRALLDYLQRRFGDLDEA